MQQSSASRALTAVAAPRRAGSSRSATRSRSIAFNESKRRLTMGLAIRSQYVVACALGP